MSRDLSIPTGLDHTWWWLSPEPLVAGSTPEMTVEHAVAGAVAPAPTLTHLVVVEPIVTAISADRTTLTIAAPVANAAGVPGEYGEAWLVTEEDGAYPVRVKRLDGTTCILADPLSSQVSLTVSAALQFRRWHTTLTVADVTGTARRGWVVNTTYAVAIGVDTPDELRRDRIVLNVVNQPFDTGLTHEGFLSWFPDVSYAAPGRQQSYEPQIERARALLIADIRARIAGSSSTCVESEDDIDGGRLEQSHAYRTAHLVYSVRDQDRATWFLEQYRALIDEELQRIWADCDGDGLPDEGELDESIGVGGGDQGRFFRNLAATPAFTRGMKH